MSTGPPIYKINNRATFEVRSKKASIKGHLGSLKAFSRSPKGREREIGVFVKDGKFVANFIPDLSGTWQVSILHNNQLIEGSPFNVKVIDKRDVRVIFNERNVVGRVVEFGVESSGYETEELSVFVFHGNKNIRAHIKRHRISKDNNGGDDDDDGDVYQISFLPVENGLYLVHVRFDGIDIRGSPFELKVENSSDVVLAGEGLKHGTVNRESVFYIDVGKNDDSSTDHCKVHVSCKENRNAASGSHVSSQLKDNHNGTLTASYTPRQTGRHVIQVTYFDTPVRGSPFFVDVRPDKVSMFLRKLPASVKIREKVTFEVDTWSSEKGDFDVKVNSGAVPCKLERLTNQMYQGSFTPLRPGVHVIKLYLKDQEQPDGKYNLMVRGANIRVIPPENNLVRSRKLCHFDVVSDVDDAIFDVIIRSPSQMSMLPKIQKLASGLSRIFYTPLEVGRHNITVKSEDSSPSLNYSFHVKVFDAATVSVSRGFPGTVGKPVELTVDTSQSGEGKIEASVNDGRVSKTLKNLNGGIYSVSFVPTEPVVHFVNIYFNGDPIYDNPISIPISEPTFHLPIGNINAHPNINNGLKIANVNSLKIKKNQSTLARDGEIFAFPQSRSHQFQKFSSHSIHSSDNRHQDHHHQQQQHHHQHHQVRTYDFKDVKILANEQEEINSIIQIEVVFVSYINNSDLRANVVGPSNENINVQIKKTSNGGMFTYVPVTVGEHLVFLYCGKAPLHGSPVKQLVSNSEMVKVYGDGLHRAFQNEEVSFVVETIEQPGQLRAEVKGPKSMSRCFIKRDSSTKYLVSYTPAEVGVFQVDVFWNDRKVADSPYHPQVSNPKKVFIASKWPDTPETPSNRLGLSLNQLKRFKFDLSRAGPGRLTVEVDGPQGNVPLEKRDVQDGVEISFVPLLEGVYKMHVDFNGRLVNGSPFYGVINSNKLARKVTSESKAVNTSEVVVSGSGLKNAKVGQEAEFYLDTSNAEPGHAKFKLAPAQESSSLVPVQSQLVRDYFYRCCYTADSPGMYLLDVFWNDLLLADCPFKIVVEQLPRGNVLQGNAARVKVVIEDTQVAVVGRDIRSTIDTRRAGRGELQARCMGPTRPAPSRLIDHYDGTFTLLVRPEQSGSHTLNIYYNGEHVKGSPFTLSVVVPPDASKVTLSGRGLRDGLINIHEAVFIADTSGAGSGELAVTIRGPKGGFNAELERRKDKVVTCRYNPTIPGEYIISVTWAGSHVPGSPFRVQWRQNTWKTRQTD